MTKTLFDGRQPFAAMSAKDKKALIRGMMSRWKFRSKDLDDSVSINVRTFLQELDRLYDIHASESPCVVGLAIAVFGNSSDTLEDGSSGLPHINEVIFQMALDIFTKFRPLLKKFRLTDDLAGYARMDQAICLSLDLGHDAAIVETAARVFYKQLYGNNEGIREGATGFVSAMFWNGIAHNTTVMLCTVHSYLHHLALPPLERLRRTTPRTISFSAVLLDSFTRKKAAEVPPDIPIWVLGATEAHEGWLAREGYFEDCAALFSLLDGVRLAVFLVSDDVFPFELLAGERVIVHARTWGELFAGKLPKPVITYCLNTGIGTLEPSIMQQWLPRLVDLLRFPGLLPIVLTSRCETEARGEKAALDCLGAKTLWPSVRKKHIRNIFSAAGGRPGSEFDENGWFIIVSRSTFEQDELLALAQDPVAFCREARRRLEVNDEANSESPSAGQAPPAGRAPAWPPSPPAGAGDAGGSLSNVVLAQCPSDTEKKDPAVFWGILDLKYDPRKASHDRVKVLETGDGRASRFSGYGAAIKESFQEEMKLEETIRRACLVENKKLTHDVLCECGYDYVQPRQACFPRTYTPDLDVKIRTSLQLGKYDYCVLKLTNRARGAGVIPLCVSELDEALRLLLQPPKNVEEWLRGQDNRLARIVSWGCFEEQLRHWWSNECPCFLVEEFCQSHPLTHEVGGVSLEFDGTMRVGFSLHREPDVPLPAGFVDTENGPALADWSRRNPNKALESTRLLSGLFQSGGRDDLRVQWLGGYWKLPVEDLASPDLRGRCISVAKRGTAPVRHAELRDIYTILGDAIPLLFGARDISQTGIQKRYRDVCPELGAFVAARLACSMRFRDHTKSQNVLNLARTTAEKAPSGQPRDLVCSYIDRNFGVMEALHGRWADAEALFKKSLVKMPTNANSHYLIGMCHLEAGKNQDAVVALEACLQLDPDFKAPYINLGVAWLRLGFYQGAEEASRAGLIRHPQTQHCCYNLGVAAFARACKQEKHERRKGVADGTEKSAADLRAESLAALEFARDNRVKENPWSARDDRLVEALEDASRSLAEWPADELPNDGWRMVNWRP